MKKMKNEKYSITNNDCISFHRLFSAAGYIAGGKNTTYEGNYELPSKGSVEKSMSKLKEVLYADGWNKSSEDLKVILFQNQSTKGSEIGIGKINYSTLRATFEETGVKIQLTQNGNYKFGTEKSTNETFATIKKQYEL